ncbi:hypothetical protein HHI36_009583 [Cryptolaemus montrouzieri]|uniref:Uncharacterized protein n=1 Tax=Cryptolaemus montrouzieri TaxID=559131 RepID=A0ABD2MGY5_9CUCU
MFQSDWLVRLPPPPAVSENSESSDDEEEITLRTIQEKIRPSKFMFEVVDNNSEGDFSSSEEEDFEVLPPHQKKTSQTTFSWIKEDLHEQNGRIINFTPVVNEDVLLPIEYFTKMVSLDILDDIIE